MNKTLFTVGFSALLLIALSFSVYSITCDTVPDYYHQFYGYAIYSGSVLTGKTVTATLGSNSFSITTNSNGYYEFKVQRCGGSSDTAITFTVCTRSATAGSTSTFVIGGQTEQNLTITSACPAAAAPGPSGGGGGGGAAGAAGAGAAAAAVPSEINLDLKPEFFTDEGYTASQTQGNTATFTVEGVKYTIEITILRDDSVTIDVAGQSKVLEIGDTVEFDVDRDGVNDISITLKGIDGGRAEIVYKRLAAPEKAVEEAPEEVEVKPPVVVPSPKKPIGWMIVGIVVVIGLVLYFAVIKKKKPEAPV